MTDSSRSGPIVVGVDTSDSARDAAGWAADLAALWGAPLQLVHVVPAAPYEPPITLRPSWLTELCDGAVRAGADARDSEVVPGDTVDLLAERAADARMLVLGSYGTGAWSGMLAGSVALGLMERVRCPVVVVRGTAPQIPPPRGGPVVVGVDGSPAGQAALEFAADFAASVGVMLFVVRTWSDVAVDRDGAMHRVDEDETKQSERAAERLDVALGPVMAAHPRLAVQREVVHDTPLRALLGAAGSARLVVVGHRSHRSASTMTLGSTSQALVEFAPCPVAVVKPAADREPATAPAASGQAEA